MPSLRPTWSVPRWVLVVNVATVTLLLVVVAVLGYRLANRELHPPEPPVITQADRRLTTPCDQQASGEGMIALRSLAVPERAQYASSRPGYDLDAVPQGFTADRIGYCLELRSEQGSQWVFTSMLATGKASDLGLPLGVSEVTRQWAEDLTVTSNVASVPRLKNGRGWLEMWPHAYEQQGSRQVAPKQGSEAELYDGDDTPVPGEYGSFQVHALAQQSPDQPTRQHQRPITALAVNGWATDGVVDVGIGPHTAGQGQAQPDWTFARNGDRFSSRRLTFFGRAAAAVVERGPQSHQLVPRLPGATSTPVQISGRVADPQARIELVVSRDRQTERRELTPTKGRFSAEITLPVALTQTTVEVEAVVNGRRLLQWRATDVVTGDAFLVQGQSNAVAQQFGGSGATDESPFVRSFGSSTAQASLSVADDQWHLARADTLHNQGSSGQWATRMARRIVDTQQVPVAIINGGEGGRPIGFFQRADRGGADLESNYGRALLRLRAAGLQERLSGILWYQGESDNDQAAAHVRGFTSLVEAWREDLLGPRIYLHQVRMSPCDQADKLALREAQRQLRDRLEVRVLSTNGLTTPLGCHFDYAGGYRDLGDWDAAVVASDLYGGPAAAAPDVTTATLDGSDSRVLWLGLRNPAGVTIEPGSAAGFRINGSRIVVGVSAQAGRLRLVTTRPIARGAVVSYPGPVSDQGSPIAGAGWVRGSSGAGLLSFAEVVLG